MNITTCKITGKKATPLAAEIAAISREHGHDVQFTHSGLFRYATDVGLADLHVVATSARWYFNSRNDAVREVAAKRIAEKIAFDYFRHFGRPVPPPAVVEALSLTGHGAYTLGGAQ